MMRFAEGIAIGTDLFPVPHKAPNNDGRKPAFHRRGSCDCSEDSQPLLNHPLKECLNFLEGSCWASSLLINQAGSPHPGSTSTHMTHLTASLTRPPCALRSCCPGIIELTYPFSVSRLSNLSLSCFITRPSGMAEGTAFRKPRNSV